MLNQLVKYDAATTNTYGESTTPLYERTPDWFAKLYLEHMAYSADAHDRRIIHDSDDSDIDPDADDIIPGKLKEGRSRTLRRIPRAEVLSLIARHVRWLIADQRRASRQTRIIEVDVWELWAHRASKAKDAAFKEQVQWGRWDEEQPEEDNDADVSDEHETSSRHSTRQKDKQKRRVAPVSSFAILTEALLTDL